MIRETLAPASAHIFCGLVAGGYVTGLECLYRATTLASTD